MSTAQRYWREIPRRYRLEAGKCVKCGYIAYPHRAVCPVCKSREFSAIKLSTSARLLTYTTIHVAPSQFEGQAPYTVGVVETEEGGRLTANIADVEPEDLKTGMPLKLEFRLIQEDGEQGVLCYGHKAVPE